MYPLYPKVSVPFGNKRSLYYLSIQKHCSREFPMPRHHFHVSPPYSNLIGRVTLCALLLAGGSGIAWDIFDMPKSGMGAINEQLLAANDALATRSVTTRAVIRQDSAAEVALLPAEVSKESINDAAAETTVVVGAEKALPSVDVD
jgi:hypothetical protein